MKLTPKQIATKFFSADDSWCSRCGDQFVAKGDLRVYVTVEEAGAEDFEWATEEIPVTNITFDGDQVVFYNEDHDLDYIVDIDAVVQLDVFKRVG